MPRYRYNVVFSDRVLEHSDAHDSAESPAEFARRVLLDILASSPELSDEFINVNVWDFDNPGKIIGRLSVFDLDQGPFPANQLHVSFHCYYIVSPGYDDLPEDAVLGAQGLDVTTGVPYGLLVPGEGPALKVRTGHSDGWITLDIGNLNAEPSADLEAWEAMEEVTLRLQGELCVADWRQSMVDGFEDLFSLTGSGYLTIRASARGRDTPNPSPGGRNPRRTPVEHHRLQAWPAPAPASAPVSRKVLKRDSATRQWESLNR